MNSRLDLHIERKNAEDIVQQFIGDKYVSANIIDNNLKVYIKFPRYSMECTRPGESIIRHY